MPSARYSRITCLTLATVALTVVPGMATGLFLWTSPLLFLSGLLARRPLSWLSLLGLVTLVMVTLRHRWYCRWICPTGQLCDTVSGNRNRDRGRSLPALGMVGAMAVLLAAALGVSLLGMLDPLALFHSFFNAFRFPFSPVALFHLGGLLLVVGAGLLVPQVWCQKLCPLGGLQDMATWLRRLGSRHRDKTTAFQPARRVTLGALGGVGFGLLFRQTATATGASLRPPGSLASDEFLISCIRCGNCAKVCPTAIIQSTLEFSNLSGLMTPHLSFASGYCLPDCTACGRVCPSGAITRFAREQKQALVIGMARIRIEDCLLSEQKECDRCRFYCTYNAVSIRTSDIDFNAWPEIHEEKCVGCGACVAACPARVITVESTTRTLSNDASNE